MREPRKPKFMDGPNKTIVLTVEDISEFELRQLAQFLKRVGFETCLRHTDNSSDTEQAYAMIGALESVRRALAEHGYCPR